MSATHAAPGLPGGAHEAHPPALMTLFFTEMWERFSYYGMRALLVLYLVHSIGLERADALQIYATYTGLVYLSGVAGGWLCDHYLGYRKSIFTGGVIMMLGHFAMAVPSLLNYALGLIVLGNGLFKPNIASFLGTFYRENDPRRDGAFSLFYMGVNTGGFLGPLIAGTLSETVGWDWGFASAGIGMGLGLLQFGFSGNRLGTGGYPPGRDRLNRRDVIHIALFALAALVLLVIAFQVWPVLEGLLRHVPGPVQALVPLGLLAWLLRDVSAKEGGESMQRVLAIMVMCAFVIAFWMGFEQGGGTMSLFADKLTDRHLLGWEIPASYFQSMNSAFIILLGPLMSLLWTRLDGSRYAISTPAKMAWGLIILGLGFVVLYIGQQRADLLGSVSPLWLLGVNFLHTVGELCLSPVGLSMVTKLAPLRLASLMMGCWYLANAIANYLAGTLESMLSTTGFPLYGFLVASSIGAGVLLLLITPILKRWMHGID